MEVVKESKDYKILKKRSGRFGIKKSSGGWINGKEKIEILVAEGLIKAAVPKKDPEPPPAETEEAATEAPAEEKAAEAEEPAAEPKKE